MVRNGGWGEAEHSRATKRVKGLGAQIIPSEVKTRKGVAPELRLWKIKDGPSGPG